MVFSVNPAEQVTIPQPGALTGKFTITVNIGALGGESEAEIVIEIQDTENINVARNRGTLTLTVLPKGRSLPHYRPM